MLLYDYNFLGLNGSAKQWLLENCKTETIVITVIRNGEISNNAMKVQPCIWYRNNIICKNQSKRHILHEFETIDGKYIVREKECNGVYESDSGPFLILEKAEKHVYNAIGSVKAPWEIIEESIWNIKEFT